jgi:hypothetical protein
LIGPGGLLLVVPHTYICSFMVWSCKTVNNQNLDVRNTYAGFETNIEGIKEDR